MQEKTAHWIKHAHLFSDDEYECSNCKKTVKKPSEQCPHCGAHMGKGEKYDPKWVDEMEILDMFGL